MTVQDLWVGVDGGNSKTVALVATRDGRIVGAARGGGCDVYASTDDGASEVATVDAVVDEALRSAGAGRSDVRATAYCLAGIDWPEDQAFMATALALRAGGASTLVMNDAFATLRAGSDGTEAVAIACGTYAATAATGRGGRRWHSGFWIPAWGGRGIGKRALQAAVRAELGIGPETLLRTVLPIAAGVETVEELLKATTARWHDGPRPDRAAWVRPVFDAAEAGDTVAAGIVEEEAHGLAHFASAAARKVGIEPGIEPATDDTAAGAHDLVVAGGVFRHPYARFVAEVEATYRASYPRARIVRPRGEPVCGAVALAMDASGDRPTVDVWQTMWETGPDDAFFSS